MIQLCDAFIMNFLYIGYKNTPIKIIEVEYETMSPSNHYFATKYQLKHKRVKYDIENDH